MSHVRLTIDKRLEFDADTTEWDRKPPDLFRDAIKPGAAPKPWLRAVAVAMADGVMHGQTMKINVTTKTANGWSMKVEYK